MPQPIAIAGAGRIAQSLGRLLRERGEPVVAIAGRDPARASAAAAFVGGAAQAVSVGELPRLARRILIAVSDTAIGAVARLLAESGMRDGCVLHTSGVCGPEVLAPLAAAGVSCGTLHPLQTVANPEEGMRALPGVAFAVDGEAPAAAWAIQIAALLDGIVLRIPPQARPVYHAAAVMAGNYLIALVSAAAILMEEAGVKEAEARRALEPLALTSVRNALQLGPAAALTGPIARGDAATVRAHLAVLAHAPAFVADLYRAAGLATLDIARRRGLPAEPSRAIEGLLREGERSA